MCSENNINLPIILGIETSCDETAAAIISGNRILSNIVYSQFNEHKDYQGVVPEIASRAHVEKLPLIVNAAFKEACVKLSDISAVAVTIGPGLIGGLHVGTSFAKSLALTNNIPFYGINHLEGHALTARLTDNVEFPFLLLLISGGHCFIAEVSDLQKYKILGQTLDDSAGEVLDKIAKMMGLGFPGGPAIERLAKDGNPDAVKLPIPLYKENHANFSFSGLKSAAARAYQERKYRDADIAASLQKTISETLIDRLTQALALSKCKTLIVAGGVASNQYIRNKLNQFVDQNNLKCVIPPVKLCTDNAAMIAWVGYEYLRAGILPDDNLLPRARWCLNEI